MRRGTDLGRRWSCPQALLIAALALWQPAFAQGLGDMYRAALRSNPTIQARQLEIERAQAAADGTASRLRPQLVLQAAMSANTYRDPVVDQSYSGKRASLQARQSVYEPSTVRRVESAQAFVEQRQQELAQARLALFNELVDRYLQALAARDELDALAAETRAAVRHVARLRAMRDRQMARVTDLLDAEAYLQSLGTRTITADNEREVAAARLRELTGQQAVQLLVLTPSSFDPVGGRYEEVLAGARQNNPRLTALVRGVEAARRAVEASRAEHLPQVAGTLSRTYADQGYDNQRSPAYHATSVGVELRVPLYEGGRVDAGVREATMRQGVAEQQLEATQREVEREALSQWLSAQANHARIASTRAELEAFDAAVRAQEASLEVGAARITDLLEARRKLLKATADHFKARYDFVRDLIALRTATGELNDADLARWDAWFAPAAR